MTQALLLLSWNYNNGTTKGCCVPDKMYTVALNCLWICYAAKSETTTESSGYFVFYTVCKMYREPTGTAGENCGETAGHHFVGIQGQR